MRILVVSNYYPPHFVGGYELGCRDVVEALRSRGHEVFVLTGMWGVRTREISRDLRRVLLGDWKSWKGPRRAIAWTPIKEWRNQAEFSAACKAFRPDVVYAWNVAGISVSALVQAAVAGIPVCSFVSDHWYSKWHTDLWVQAMNRLDPASAEPLWTRIVAAVLAAGPSIVHRQIPTLPLHLQFCSTFLQQEAAAAGKDIANSEVIHWGVNIDHFVFADHARRPTRLLYVGQLIEHKGVHVAIEALGALARNPQFACVTLTIIGKGADPVYNAFLAERAEQMGVRDRVEFRGVVPRQELIRLYESHDILVLPSVWDEPFSIALLEGMACGLVPVASMTGGTPEVLDSGRNGMGFARGDSGGCAVALAKIIDDTDLFHRLRAEARRTIEEKHTLTKMVARIEASLQTVVGGMNSTRCAV